MEPLIRTVPTSVVIDHMARPDVTVEVEKNGYSQCLLELGANRRDPFGRLLHPTATCSARPEDWVVALPFAHALLRHFPGQVIRGTDGLVPK